MVAGLIHTECFANRLFFLIFVVETCIGKECRIYAVCGVSQMPNNIKNERSDTIFMKKNLKKLLAVCGIIAMLGTNGITSNAATATFVGQTITYNKTRVSDTLARATTSTSGSDYVQATITVTYRKTGNYYTKSATGNGKTAAQGNYAVEAGGYITAISSYHKAGFYYQGADRVWSDYL